MFLMNNSQLQPKASIRNQNNSNSSLRHQNSFIRGTTPSSGRASQHDLTFRSSYLHGLSTSKLTSGGLLSGRNSTRSSTNYLNRQPSRANSRPNLSGIGPISNHVDTSQTNLVSGGSRKERLRPKRSTSYCPQSMIQRQRWRNTRNNNNNTNAGQQISATSSQMGSQAETITNNQLRRESKVGSHIISVNESIVESIDEHELENMERMNALRTNFLPGQKQNNSQSYHGRPQTSSNSCHGIRTAEPSFSSMEWGYYACNFFIFFCSFSEISLYHQVTSKILSELNPNHVNAFVSRNYDFEKEID